jgi:hypothetical protein
VKKTKKGKLGKGSKPANLNSSIQETGFEVSAAPTQKKKKTGGEDLETQLNEIQLDDSFSTQTPVAKKNRETVETFLIDDRNSLSASTSISAPVSRAAIRPGRATLQWSIGLAGESFANAQEQAQTAGFNVGGDFRYVLLRGLDLRVRAGASLQSGYAQSRFGDNTPRSGLNLREAIVQYRPGRILTLQVGAIDQGHLASPLLVSARPFPGALEKLTLGEGALQAEVKAQQTIPTSTTMSTQAVEAETSPSFMSETLTVKLEPHRKFNLSVYGTHFGFRNLPSTVAADGDIHGNTVDDSTPNFSRFIYEYDGWVAGGVIRTQLSRGFAAELQGQMLQNLKAPETYRNGQMASVAIEVGLPGDVLLVPKAQMFFSESDVSPSFYNSSELGHNNRIGHAADIEARFKRENFKIGARYVQSDTINSNLNQTPHQYLMLRFETSYDAI